MESFQHGFCFFGYYTNKLLPNNYINLDQTDTKQVVAGQGLLWLFLVQHILVLYQGPVLLEPSNTDCGIAVQASPDVICTQPGRLNMMNLSLGRWGDS